MAALTPPVTADDEYERMRQERDYWKSLFDSVIEQVPEPAVVLNAEGVVTHWNGGMASLTGVDPETAVGTHAREVDGELAAARALQEAGAVRSAAAR